MNIERNEALGAPEPGSGAVYFPTLDGLRFVAFLLVFFHHAPRSDLGGLAFLHDHGWVGVHIFLFLSAYLLSAILRQEWLMHGAISFKRFMSRRVLRIWPLYFVFCAFAAALMALKSGWSVSLGLRWAGLMLFVDNIVSGLRGYNPLPFTAHLWTISLEEQFYVLLPFLVLGACGDVTRLRRRLLAGWGAFIAARTTSVLVGARHPWVWTALFSADALLLGTFMGASDARWMDGPLKRLSLLGGGLLLFASAFLPDMRTSGFHQVVLYAFVAVGAASWTLCALELPWLRWLGARPLRYLGKISYGLYVFHFLGIAVGEKVGSRFAAGWAFQVCASFLVTVLLSVVSFELFERRFLRLKRRFETVRTRTN